MLDLLGTWKEILILKDIIQCLSDGLADERHGSLMRHEYAYVMGQLGDSRVRLLFFFANGNFD